MGNDQGTHILEKIAAVVKEHLKASLDSETSMSDETETHVTELDQTVSQIEDNVINGATPLENEDEDEENLDESEWEPETEFETLNAQL